MFYRIRRGLRFVFPKINIELLYSHNLKFINKEKSNLNIKIELLNSKNIHRIQEVKKLGLSRLKQRLNRGDKCYVAIFEDNIISYHWVQFSGLHFLQQMGQNIHVKKQEFWIYHVRVKEFYRGKRINGAVYSKILEDARLKGEVKAWVYTNVKNRANRIGLEKMNFKVEQKIYSIKFKNKYYCLYKFNL